MSSCLNYSTDTGKFACTATVYQKCRGEDCAFHMTAEQQQESLEASHARIRTLETEHQDYISQKYYSGRTPWEERA